jgi:hypothetical protein
MMASIAGGFFEPRRHKGTKKHKDVLIHCAFLVLSFIH